MDTFETVAAASRVRLVPLRILGAGPPLFCFPGSGGNVHIFREMISALPDGQPVYGVDMEWLCDARTEFTIEQVAAHSLEVIRRVQSHGPYFFCGYSFGGLVAYEIAIRLKDEGDKVGLLGLLDAPNPALMSNLSASQSAQFRKRYLSDRVRKYAGDLIRGDVRAFAHRGLAFFISRAGRPFLPAVKFWLRLFKWPLPAAIQSNDPGFLKAWRAYVPNAYRDSVVCFKVEERGPEHDADPTMGWGACASGGVEVNVVPGSHVDMMKMPSVGVIAEKVAGYLNFDQAHRQELKNLEQSSCKQR
jgi:thioesterase domain-containing protein